MQVFYTQRKCAMTSTIRQEALNILHATLWACKNVCEDKYVWCVVATGGVTDSCIPPGLSTEHCFRIWTRSGHCFRSHICN
jgi:hypothetical protein